MENGIVFIEISVGGDHMNLDTNPKVFISYSQDSLNFSNRVLTFSNKLRSEGIDAILDQYEEAPPEGWPRWMENSIKEADYVVIIASQGYYEKIYEIGKSGKGLGVKWESNIIYQMLYTTSSINEKFIPVIFCENDIQFIPTPLLGNTYYNISNNSDFDRLYWRLRGVSTKEKPPLGKLRPLPVKERKTLFFTSVIDVETWDKAVWRGVGFITGFKNLPVLLLPFANEKYAIKIFEDWIFSFGNVDKKDNIRVALVEGEVQGEPPGYYIVISTNLDEAVKRAEKNGLSAEEMLIMNVARFIRANPSDNFKCYNLFKQAYEKAQEYYLMPAIINESTGQIKPLPSYGIRKKMLIYRDLKDITEHDEDAILLQNANHKL